MVSPELLRRSPVFAGLSPEQINALAYEADTQSVESGYVFFREGTDLDRLYIVTAGSVGMLIELHDQQRSVLVGTLGVGQSFGWSALVPPYQAIAGAEALSSCSVIVLDAAGLRRRCEEDCQLGYLMTQRAAQTFRERLRDLRIETLAYMAN